MKNCVYILVLLISINSFSQSEKETVYLLFDRNAKEDCNIEDGSGNTLKVKKYRKEYEKNVIIFHICEEVFVFNKETKIDTCNVKYLDDIKFETIQSISKKVFFFKSGVFENIYIIESYKNNIIKYKVIWTTDLTEEDRNYSNLGEAPLFPAHEIIYAEIFRKMLSSAQLGNLNTLNMTAQQQVNYAKSLKDNFSGLYDYYWKRHHTTWNHNMMASHYRSTIADMMQEFDNNRLPRSTYEAIAWVGLGEIEENQTTIVWSNLSSTEKDDIKALINQNFFNGTSNCN